MKNIEIEWLKEEPIAHRGLFDKENPENSLKAFKKAIDNNYAIELDIQFTKDKQIVVFHDETLERMTKNLSYVSDMTYKQLSKLKLLNTDEKIPLLEDVLKVVDGKVPIIIEIKDSKDIIDLGKEAYEILKRYNGKYTIQSFNPIVLQWYSNNAKEVVRGQLSGKYNDSNSKINFLEKFLLKNLLLDFKSKPHYICYELQGLPNLRVSQIRKKGTMVISWTIRNKKDMEKAYKYSDNIIFDSFIPKQITK